ncbi:MAG: hypothetical protein EBZ59_10015 [Planctomycetia bacterium]|nr:hypothetical protein [Planctomycetia bacterium]
MEKIHFQSLPGLFVTASLYRPAAADGRLPAILYVCGHAERIRNGVSIGNKASYTRHGAWFARHGYVCLIIDSLELGEILAEHHGTYSRGRWWWWSRGYTPAGVETWNGIRAIDYLATRGDVDATRIGVTGRSGGGATSWWIAALDERVRAAAPTAGICCLHEHVVGGCVEGHCDCMYFNNTHRWDFPRVAALVAPRPLLICNTDKDAIFPIDGVYRLHRDVRRVYGMLDADKSLGLHVAEGGHKDLQPLHVGAFHWFDRHLKNADPMQVVDEAARDLPDPDAVRVFAELPASERNTTIDEVFVPRLPPPPVPRSRTEWDAMQGRWTAALLEKTFAGWPAAGPVEIRLVGSESRDGLRMTAHDFESQSQVVLRLFLVHRENLRPEAATSVVLDILDEEGWRDVCTAFAGRFGGLGLAGGPESEKAFGVRQRQCAEGSTVFAFVCPRGIGPTAWSGSERVDVHRRRRFHLLGQTLDGMRVWDIRRGVQAVRRVPGLAATPLSITAREDLAADALYAAIFEPGITELDLQDVPTTHDGGRGDTAARAGPALLRVLDILDLPQAAAVVADRCGVGLTTDDPAAWRWAAATVEAVGQRGRLAIRDAQQPRADPAAAEDRTGR